MGLAYPPGPIEALDAFVDVLADADAGTTRDAFYGRLCNVVCRLTSVNRAVIFRYDDAQRRVRAAGAHNVPVEFFADKQVNVESAPIARRSLEADAVVEAFPPFGDEVPAEYRALIGEGSLVCVPLSAGGRWIGVIIGERASHEPLAHAEVHFLWTLGKTAALAAIARIATFDGERARELQQRIDVAREVHERIVQRLFGVSLALGSEIDFPVVERRRMSDEIQAVLADLRNVLQRPLSRNSRPTTTTLGEELARLVREHPDLAIEVDADPEPAVPEDLEPVAQSVLAEAVRNALGHADPTKIKVVAGQRDGAFILEVSNDGVPTTKHRRRTTGMGLRLAAFEALQAGGVVEFGAREPGTWQVTLVVPLDADD